MVTLGQGSVFGEIALLGVGGMNRRTADVVSRGFSNLFVLQKDDLETVLKDYADAKRILNARARKLMKVPSIYYVNSVVYILTKAFRKSKKNFFILLVCQKLCGLPVITSGVAINIYRISLINVLP